MMKYILGTILTMVLWMALSYYDRGYWAVGAEFMFPMMAYLLYKFNEEESH